MECNLLVVHPWYVVARNPIALAIHFCPTPLGPNLQTLGGIRLGLIKGTNLCFLYEDKNSNKYARFG
jgi:hypothetical protein